MPFSSTLRDVTPYLIYLLLIATIGPLLFGYHLAELNAPQEVITCVRSGLPKTSSVGVASLAAGSESRVFPKEGLPKCIPMSTIEFGIVSSFFTLGGLLGALSSGPLAGRLGRLRAMQTAAIFAAIGPIFEALTPNVPIFTIGRFLSGIGAGGATVVVPIYISEIAPSDQRGFFGTFTQVMVNVGILATQLLGLFLSKGRLWRIILAVGGAIAAAQFVGLLLAGQESPVWMADHGRPSEAKQTLRRIRGLETNVDGEVSSWGLGSERDPENERETLLANEDRVYGQVMGPGERVADMRTNENVNEIPTARTSNEPPRTNTSLGFFAVLHNADSRPAVFAVVMVMLSQQLLGINSIVMYGVGLLSKLLAANSAVLNVAVSALNIFVTICAAPLIEKAGRKTCLLGSMGGMGVSSLLLAVGIMRHMPILSAVAVVCFVASFGLGLGPIPFILSSELVGPEAVGATKSWDLAANWIATFVVAQFFPVLNDAMGKGQVYFIFAAFALFFGLITLYFVPETKGKTADEAWGRKARIVRED